MAGPVLKIRPATAADSATAFEWRNDPDARAASWSTDAVEWSSHARWWNESLTDGDRVLLVVEEGDGAALGILRFDRLSGAEWVVSINIAPEARGRGIGSAVLPQACEWLERTRGAEAVRAEVRVGNHRSMSLFRSCGFSLLESDGDRANFVRMSAGRT